MISTSLFRFFSAQYRNSHRRAFKLHICTCLRLVTFDSAWIENASNCSDLEAKMIAVPACDQAAQERTMIYVRFAVTFNARLRTLWNRWHFLLSCFFYTGQTALGRHCGWRRWGFHLLLLCALQILRLTIVTVLQYRSQTVSSQRSYDMTLLPSVRLTHLSPKPALAQGFHRVYFVDVFRFRQSTARNVQNINCVC